MSILVELFAEAAEELSAAEEALAAEAYIATAAPLIILDGFTRAGARSRRCAIRSVRRVAPSINCGQVRALYVFRRRSSNRSRRRFGQKPIADLCRPRILQATIGFAKTRIAGRRRAELRGQPGSRAFWMNCALQKKKAREVVSALASSS